ncbi:hypothetical protein M569_01459 [Genlisea aurea]|uniref:Protein kinase domain-containing protein n=1 Tax=Genlisea aurea TaxID=192259 RepID=S8D774_9LAMI|nr:hypothetical protein M569_01459 [Genlisea aurea]
MASPISTFSASYFPIGSVKFGRFQSGRRFFSPGNSSLRLPALTRAFSDGGGQDEIIVAKELDSNSLEDPQTSWKNSSDMNDGYLALFIRMLGIDNELPDREQAVVALWKYSLGGKQYVDSIMRYSGALNLVVNILKSDSDSACEASAGLLRTVSSINIYRDAVAASGAIEEMTYLLARPELSSGVKEQALCTLWNLAVDEKLSAVVSQSEIFPLVVEFLDDEDMKVKEAAAGVLANLALSPSNHKIIVEAGVIPKMASFLTKNVQGSKVIAKIAKNALLELAKDDYYRLLVMEEGLVIVPLFGAAAYKNFKPDLYSRPSLPDGTTSEGSTTSKIPSRYGASEILLGLNVNVDLDESKAKAVISRTQQRFLARIGAIEIENRKNQQEACQGFTLLPWFDAVARLVLVLELEDESSVARAAESIATASINEQMHVSFEEAGAIKPLVRLISHPDDGVKSAAIRALDRLSISINVCQRIEAEGGLRPLVISLKRSMESDSGASILSILSRILDPNNDTKVKRKAASILEFLSSINNAPLLIGELLSAGIESSLEHVFHQKHFLTDSENEKPEVGILALEEAGQTVSAASRLLLKLLDHQQFRAAIDAQNLTASLRSVLRSDIPLDNKNWVVASLLKLTSQPGGFRPSLSIIIPELILYETIPRLIRVISDSPSSESQEAAVLELNRLVSEGLVDSTRAVASGGGIYPLVKLMEKGSSSDRAVEASLAILYNLSMERENHAAIVAAGAVPVLRKLVIAERPPWVRALRLLRALPSVSKDRSQPDLERLTAQELKEFSFPTLVAATRDFHRSLKLGEGGFGPVYKGTLDDGREIAVKKLSHKSFQGEKQFQSELKLLAQIQHRNVVKLLGYCAHGAEKLLVYQYIPNESLDKLLFKSDKRDLLDWKRRFDIILGVAKGLLYLHDEAHCRIIHRDIKASNILLDDKWVPKIADFGMARLYPEDKTHVNTLVAGTNGYMAPEYVMHGHLTEKADVFSYGVVVLELISGLKNSSFNKDADSDNLLDWAYKLYKKGRSLEMMDAALVSSADGEEVSLCIQIGLLCVQSDFKTRPSMERVMVMLSQKATTAMEEPTRPGYPGSRISRNVAIPSSSRTTVPSSRLDTGPSKSDLSNADSDSSSYRTS